MSILTKLIKIIGTIIVMFILHFVLYFVFLPKDINIKSIPDKNQQKLDNYQGKIQILIIIALGTSVAFNLPD